MPEGYSEEAIAKIDAHVAHTVPKFLGRGDPIDEDLVYEITVALDVYVVHLHKSGEVPYPAKSHVVIEDDGSATVTWGR